MYFVWFFAKSYFCVVSVGLWATEMLIMKSVLLGNLLKHCPKKTSTTYCFGQASNASKWCST